MPLHSVRTSSTDSCEQANPRKYQVSWEVYYTVATAVMTYYTHGYQNSVTNGMIILDPFLKQFPDLDTMHTSGTRKETNATNQGLVVGSYLLGCAVGSLACSYLMGKLGRKKVTQLLGVCIFIGIVLQLTSFRLAHFIVGRVVLGLGIGMGHSTFPLYISECIRPDIRGAAVIACGVAANFGHVIGAATEVGILYGPENSFQWRFPLGLELITGTAAAIMPMWLMETPKWLLSHGREFEAIAAIAKLNSVPTDSACVERELAVLKNAIESNPPHDLSSANAYKKTPSMRVWRSGLAIFIQMMASFSGMEIISYYSTTIFEGQLHFSAEKSRLLTFGLQLCQFFASAISMYVVDKLGRRPLVAGCAICMAVSMGFLSWLNDERASTPMLKGSVLFQYLIMCAYPVGFHLIPWMFSAELAPVQWRHSVTAIAGTLHWLSDFLVSMVTPLAMASIHSRYFYVYMACNILTFIVVLLFFPETKGLRLETIDVLFEQATSYTHVVTLAKTAHRFGPDEVDEIYEKSSLISEKHPERVKALEA